MNTRTRRISLALISVLLLLLSPAATGYAKSTSDNKVQLIVSEDPSFEDTDWSIVKTEDIVVRDPSTGKETVVTAVTRQGSVQCGDKMGKVTYEADSVALPLITCVKQTSTTYTGSSRVFSGAVKGYVKVFADVYCGSDNNCLFSKMTKVQAWWTRSGTGYVVRSAYILWGCAHSFCTLCSNNGPWGPSTQRSTTFTPAWNGLTSQVYYLTSSSWPVMMTNNQGDVLGYSHGVVESPSHTIQNLDVWSILPGPW